MEEALIEAGLSKNEASTYLALNEMGSATAGQIAQKANLHRPNVYDALKRLVQKGLAAYITKNQTKHYSVTDADNLLKLLQEKENRIKAILPQLALAREIAEKKDKATVMNGLEGIRATTNDILRTCKKGDEVVTWGVPKDVPDKMKYILPQYHKQRIQKGITQRHLYNENAADRIEYLNKMKSTGAGYLPKEYDSPVTTTVYGDTVVFWLWDNSPLSVVIESAKMAAAYRRYFELLWNIAHKH